MTTSLADLLWTLDDEPDPPPGDAAAALGHASTVLSRLTFIGKYAEPSSQRADVIRSLAGASAAVAAAWPQQPGRSTELMGVIADVVGREQDRLSEADKWQIALSTATLARRWAGVINDDSPKYQAPRLAMLISAADGLRRLAAHAPPQPAQFDRLTEPITSAATVLAADPVQACAISVAGIADLLDRRGRTRLTVRQMIGLCNAAEAITEATEQLLPETAGTPPPSRAWRETRAALSNLTDGIADPTAGNNGNVFFLAARAHHSISRVVAANLSQADGAQVQEAVDSLSRVATGIERDLRGMPHRLLVRHGERPIREERVGEWLNRRAFIANADDLDLVKTLLQRSKIETRTLASTLAAANGQETAEGHLPSGTTTGHDIAISQSSRAESAALVP